MYLNKNIFKCVNENDIRKQQKEVNVIIIMTKPVFHTIADYAKESGLDFDALISKAKVLTNSKAEQVLSSHDVKLAELAVSTLTMTVHLPEEGLIRMPINLDALYSLAEHVLDEKDEEDDIVDAITNPGRVPTLRIDPTKRRFQNSVVFKVNIVGYDKCIKVFRNGVMHLTGAKIGNHVELMILAALQAVERAGKEEAEFDSAWDDMFDEDEDVKDDIFSVSNATITTPAATVTCGVLNKICMLNCYTSLGYVVDMNAFRECLESKYSIVVIYNRDVYPGLKFTCRDGGATVVVFMTGKVLLSAGNMDSIVAAHAFIADFGAQEKNLVQELCDKVERDADALNKIFDEIFWNDFDEPVDNIAAAVAAAKRARRRGKRSRKAARDGLNSALALDDDIEFISGPAPKPKREVKKAMKNKEWGPSVVFKSRFVDDDDDDDDDTVVDVKTE